MRHLYLLPTICVKPELCNFFKTFSGDKELNSPMELSVEAQRELTLEEKKL